jgi:glycine/D-amino acid oxidase-like deaminating enzyme
VIGSSQTVPNRWHAFGFIVGSLLADLIVEAKSPLPIDAFRPGRFKEDVQPPDATTIA